MMRQITPLVEVAIPRAPNRAIAAPAREPRVATARTAGVPVDANVCPPSVERRSAPARPSSTTRWAVSAWTATGTKSPTSRICQLTPPFAVRKRVALKSTAYPTSGVTNDAVRISPAVGSANSRHDAPRSTVIASAAPGPHVYAKPSGLARRLLKRRAARHPWRAARLLPGVSPYFRPGSFSSVGSVAPTLGFPPRRASAAGTASSSAGSISPPVTTI